MCVCRVFEDHGFRYSSCLAREQLVGYLGYARLYGPRGHVPTEPYRCGRLFRRGGHGLRVHEWQGKSVNRDIKKRRDLFLNFEQRPYVGKSRKEIRDQILAKQVHIKRDEIPSGWSIEAADFVNRMIQRKPQNRLGANGVQEIKNHPWLKRFPWDDLKNKRVLSPFIPPAQDNFDQKNINEEWKDLEDEQFIANEASLPLRET